MAVKIQLRRDTAGNWTSVDPILAEGEIGIELGSSNYKIGNGTTKWSLLPYVGGSGDIKADGTIAFTNTFTGTRAWITSGLSAITLSATTYSNLPATIASAGCATNAKLLDGLSASQLSATGGWFGG